MGNALQPIDPAKGTDGQEPAMVFNPAKLLLVEDDVAMRDTLDCMLTDAGFEVLAAQGGVEGMREVACNASRFSAVVTDIDLGCQPDGWDIARRARQSAPDVPIIYISGSSGHCWPWQGVPNSLMLEKPFRIGELLAAIDRLLQASVEFGTDVKNSYHPAGQACPVGDGAETERPTQTHVNLLASRVAADGDRYDAGH